MEPQRYERIAARLVADIRAGRLAPGEKLPPERELARRLGVGRASVREALAALPLRGALETRPGAGSFVVGPPEDDGALPTDASPSDLLEARLLLEPQVAGARRRPRPSRSRGRAAARCDGRGRGRRRPRRLERR